MAGQKQDDQHEYTFNSYVRIRDVALKTNQRRWIIGRSVERESQGYPCEWHEMMMMMMMISPKLIAIELEEFELAYILYATVTLPTILVLDWDTFYNYV